jgi:hypothetical protein
MVPGFAFAFRLGPPSAMWCIEYDPDTRVLALRLTRQITPASMRALMRANAQALGAIAGDEFRVLVDLRGIAPLDRDAAELFTDIKRSAQALPGFRERVVLCDSATVAMQQRRTSIEEGTSEIELITFDDGDARRMLRLPAAGPTR